jgi:hypothetical protein
MSFNKQPGHHPGYSVLYLERTVTQHLADLSYRVKNYWNNDYEGTGLNYNEAKERVMPRRTQSTI